MVAHQQSVDTLVRARAAAYLMFARLFREAPSEALLKEIVQRNLFTATEQWGGSLKCAGHPLDPAKDTRWLEQGESIAVEYARLFAVPGRQAVQPYESVYCDTLTIDTSINCSPYFSSEPPPDGLAGFLHGTSAISVRDAYRQSGFDLDPSICGLPDHLGIELEFMSLLLERGTLDQAAAFFRAHPGRWVFRCLDEIKQKTDAAEFYRTVVDALAKFLLCEREALLALR